MSEPDVEDVHPVYGVSRRPDGILEVECDLIDSGLLWYINRVAFHPRGLALAYDREAGRFLVWGNRQEPWVFPVEVDDSKFPVVEALFDLLKD